MVNGPVAPAILNCVTVIVFPSGSESFANTLPVIGVSSGVEMLSSFTAIGPSFTAVTVKFKAPTSVPPAPSVMVYSTEGTVPL